jgi:hypothetical protein
MIIVIVLALGITIASVKDGAKVVPQTSQQIYENGTADRSR